MVEYLDSFCDNKYLFKCDRSQFNVVIKFAMTKLIKYEKHGIVHIIDDTSTKCVICHQRITCFHEFSICCNCCKYWVNKEIILNLAEIKSYIAPTLWQYNNHSRKYDIIMTYNYYHYFPEFTDDSWFSITGHDNYNRFVIYSHFINNSFRLKHRFYHDTQSILLLSIYDTSSSCSILNWDIMIHILKFIY